MSVHPRLENTDDKLTRVWTKSASVKTPNFP